jgi:hypothetical protein
MTKKIIITKKKSTVIKNSNSKKEIIPLGEDGLISQEKVSEMLKFHTGNPDSLNKKVQSEVKKYSRTESDKESKKLFKEIAEDLNKLSRTYTLTTKHCLRYSVSKAYELTVLQVCQDLEKEYGVKTPSEKALAQMAAIAFCRMLQFADYSDSSCKPEWVSHEKAHFVSIYMKEFDRAQRQFISAIQMLHQLKTPPLKINVKTQTAFIAQNQQNNANPNQ